MKRYVLMVSLLNIAIACAMEGEHKAVVLQENVTLFLDAQQELQKLRAENSALKISTTYLLDLYKNNGTLAKPELGQETVVLSATKVQELTSNLVFLSNFVAEKYTPEITKMKQDLAALRQQQPVTQLVREPRGFLPQTHRDYKMMMGGLAVIFVAKVMQDLISGDEWCLCL